jgi:hypothetical protein
MEHRVLLGTVYPQLSERTLSRQQRTYRSVKLCGSGRLFNIAQVGNKWSSIGDLEGRSLVFVSAGVGHLVIAGFAWPDLSKPAHERYGS